LAFWFLPDKNGHLYPRVALSSQTEFKILLKKDILLAGRRWLTPVIPATQEAEIRRMAVQSQPQANSSEDPISKKKKKKKKRKEKKSQERAGGVAQVVRVPPYQA
jgi:hypothetical protein